jgi:hypothetical protein
LHWPYCECELKRNCELKFSVSIDYRRRKGESLKEKEKIRGRQKRLLRTEERRLKDKQQASVRYEKYKARQAAARAVLPDAFGSKQAESRALNR